EVMANLGKDSVTFQKKSPTPGGSIGRDQYPLGEKMPDKVKSATGKVLADFTLDKVKSGELKAEDFRIAPETLEMQAQVAESVDRDNLARNMRRAAELIAVPDDQLLSVYNALRPYRSTKAELYGIADELEQKYQCKVNAAFIREAADVYEKRGRLKVD
ncbi:MAG: diol dehydratase small subunit, partial [Propionicimonas sp.]